MDKRLTPLSWLEIDLKALRLNYREIKRKVKSAGILAVIKEMF